MSMELLHQIATGPVPLNVIGIDEIDKLRVLRAAGLVTVNLPSMTSKRTIAKVLTLTQLGWDALNTYNPAAPACCQLATQFIGSSKFKVEICA